MLVNGTAGCVLKLRQGLEQKNKLQRLTSLRELQLTEPQKSA